MLQIQNPDGTIHPLEYTAEGATIKSWPWIIPGPLDERGYPGAVLVDAPPPPPGPPPVPQAVTPLQARRAINAAGLRASIEAAIAAADQDAKDAWEYATEIRRDNALIASMAGALGLTSAQIDDLFRDAATR